MDQKHKERIIIFRLASKSKVVEYYNQNLDYYQSI